MHSEFSLISSYFNRFQSSSLEVETGIGDDCALINISYKKTLTISTDTLVCGYHFLPDIDPADLAYKALAVNISDLAAMGASPTWLMLALTLPYIDEIWLKNFSDSLFEHLNYYGMQLIGGDTTAGPLSITLTIYGYVPIGCAIKRTGAKPGDFIYVTGTLGDSAAGLAILKKELVITDKNDSDWLIKRHLRPTPRLHQGQALLNCASSAIDISDGLISDLNHILKSSAVGALINLDRFKLSVQMRKHVKPEQALHWALSGGEDYELCFTVSEINLDTLKEKMSHLKVELTCIGQITHEKEKLQFIKKGKLVSLNWKGFDHFV